MARVVPQRIGSGIAQMRRPCAPCCRRVIARDGDAVDVALLDCSGREEMGRLHSSEKALLDHVGAPAK